MPPDPKLQGLCDSLDILMVSFQMLQVGDDTDSALQHQHLLHLHVSSCPCFESSLYADVEINHSTHRKFFHLLLGWAQWHLHRAGLQRVKQGRRAQRGSHWSGPSPLFSLQPAWSRCCRQAGCSPWLWGIPLCSLLPRLHQWHRYGLALKTEVVLYNRLLVLLDGHVLVHSFSAQPQAPAPDSSSLWAVPLPLLCGALSGAPLGSTGPPWPSKGWKYLTCAGNAAGAQL